MPDLVFNEGSKTGLGFEIKHRQETFWLNPDIYLIVIPASIEPENRHTSNVVHGIAYTELGDGDTREENTKEGDGSTYDDTSNALPSLVDAHTQYDKHYQVSKGQENWKQYTMQFQTNQAKTPRKTCVDNLVTLSYQKAQVEHFN